MEHCQLSGVNNLSLVLLQGCYEAPPDNGEPVQDTEMKKLRVEPALKCCSVNWALWIDKTCVMLFPAIYLTFNIVYWNYYINVANK